MMRACLIRSLPVMLAMTQLTDRMVQKSDASPRLVTYAYGMVKYPLSPHVVPHELRTMNRLDTSSYPTANTACPPSRLSPCLGMGTTPVSASVVLSKLAYTLNPNTNGYPPARHERIWSRSRVTRWYSTALVLVAVA